MDKEELESAFSEKTRAIVLNTPHNPVGKVSGPSGPMVRRTLTQERVVQVSNLERLWFCGFILYFHSELLGQPDRMLQHNLALMGQYSIQIE